MESTALYVLFNLAFLLISVNGSNTNSTDDGVVFCYYDSASNTRPDYARFGIDNIPLDLCTHLIYSFMVPTADGNITFSEPQGIVEGKSNTFEDFIGLKNSTDVPNVKFMASLGGLKAGSENFTLVVNNQTLRNQIIDNIYTFIRTNNLDGIDLLWQYPTLNGGAPTDKVKYTAFIRNLRAILGGKYLITAAVGPSQLQINESYYVQELNQHLDYISVMTYNYHDSSENVTGVNSPLYAQETDSEEDSAKNVNASISTWIANGASPSKLVLGLGAFGKAFKLASLNDTGTGAPVTGGNASGLTGVEGEWSYLEICTDQAADPDSWEITEIDSEYVYANRDLLWVGYDNVNTIFAKGSYAKSMGLAGVSLWSLDLADFSDACGEQYLLIKAADEGYKTASVIDTGNNTSANETTANPAQNRTYITIITDDLAEENDKNEDVNVKHFDRISLDNDKNAVEDEASQQKPAESNANDEPKNDEQSSKLSAQSIRHDLLQKFFIHPKLYNQQQLINQQKLKNLQKRLQSQAALLKIQSNLRKVGKSTNRDKARKPWKSIAGGRNKISISIPSLLELNIGK